MAMRRLIPCCLSVLLLGGCGVELLTTTAIQSELQAESLYAAKNQLSRVGAQMGEARLRRAIDAFNAETGGYPPSLDVLAPGYIPAIPIKGDGTPYHYDPATGRLIDRPLPAIPSTITAQDEEYMGVVREAIQRYGRTTGRYPASLQVLAQQRYLRYVPKTSSGQDYVYYPQTGALHHPAALAQQGYGGAQRAPRRGAAAGPGPLGDAMTGISVQNQLNQMNNSGASQGGGYARRGIRGKTDQYNQRQSQAIKDLDL